MVNQDLPITSENLKKYMYDIEIVPKVAEKTILEIFKTHKLEVESLIGKGFARGTYDRYEVSYQHTEAFMLWKYNVKDVLLNQVNHEFVTSYDYFLRSVQSCANNTTVKYIKNFKKIVLIALANGWLEKNPLKQFFAGIGFWILAYLIYRNVKNENQVHNRQIGITLHFQPILVMGYGLWVMG